FLVAYLYGKILRAEVQLSPTLPRNIAFMLLGEKLSKTYSSGKVLENVTVQIAPGQIYGLLGRNGAGKSTLFKILCGLIKPDTGTVSVQAAQAKPIGAIIEKPGLYPYLNAADNL